MNINYCYKSKSVEIVVMIIEKDCYYDKVLAKKGDYLITQIGNQSCEYLFRKEIFEELFDPCYSSLQQAIDGKRKDLDPTFPI